MGRSKSGDFHFIKHLGFVILTQSASNGSRNLLQKRAKIAECKDLHFQNSITKGMLDPFRAEP